MKKAIITAISLICVVCIGLTALFATPTISTNGGGAFGVDDVKDLAAAVAAQSLYTGLPQKDEAIPDGLVPWDGEVATKFAGGTGTPADPYQIATPAQWALLIDTCNRSLTDEDNNNGARYATLDYVITADLCFNENFTVTDYTVPDSSTLRATPVLDTSIQFEGVLNGDGYRMYNIYASASLLSEVTGSVKNLHLVRGYINVKGNTEWVSISTGSIAGDLMGSGSVNACSSSVTIYSTGDCVGGLVGRMRDSAKITSCEFRGSVYARSRVGGMLGQFVEATQYLQMVDCINRGSVFATSQDVGGIIGHVTAGDARNLPGFAILQCVNFGAVEASGTRSSGDVTTSLGSNAGGIVGNIARVDSVMRRIDHCVNFGTVKASVINAGGIVGTFNVNPSKTGITNNIQIHNSYNYGTIESAENVGGMIGFARGAVDLTLSGNTGAVIGQKTVGGMVGCSNSSVWSAGASMVTLRACWQTGNVSASEEIAGGVVGQIVCGTELASGVYIGGTLIAGSVTAPRSVGGLAGTYSASQYSAKGVVGGDYSVASIVITVGASNASYGRLVGGLQTGAVATFNTQERFYVASEVYVDADITDETAPEKLQGTLYTIYGNSTTTSANYTYAAENLTNGSYLSIMNIYSTSNSLSQWAAGPDGMPEHRTIALMKALTLSRRYDMMATSVNSSDWSGTVPVVQWYRKNGTDWEIIANAPSAVGEYCVEMALLSDRASGAVRREFIIDRQLFDVSTLSWPTETKLIYNGKLQSVGLQGAPAFLDLEYSDNTATNFGRYTATLVSATDNSGNYEIVGQEKVEAFAWEIQTLELNVANITWSNIPEGGTRPTLSYNEETQTIRLIDKTNPDLDLSILIHIDYVGNTGRDARDDYRATATLEEIENNNIRMVGIFQREYTTVWIIEKRLIDPDAIITFDDLTISYDTLLHTIAYDTSALPDCVQVTPSANNVPRTAAGIYEYILRFSLTDTANNELTATEVKRTLTISPAVPTIRADGMDTTYTGDAFTIPEGSFSISGLDALKNELKECGTLRYEYYYVPSNEDGETDEDPLKEENLVTEAINAGDYRVKVVFDPGNNTNFAETYITVQMYINRATLALAGNIVLRDASKLWTGEPQNLKLLHEDELPDFVHARYSAPYTDVGQYTVVCNFDFTPAMEGNYQPIQPMTATLSILTYELRDDETMLTIIFPTGQPTVLRLLVQERENPSSFNTAWQIGWHTSLKSLYQVELKRELQPIDTLQSNVTVLLPVNDAILSSKNVTAVSVDIDEKGNYSMTEMEWDYQDYKGETYIAISTNAPGHFGVVTDDPITGMTAWMVIAAFIALPSIVVLTFSVILNVKRKRKMK